MYKRLIRCIILSVLAIVCFGCGRQTSSDKSSQLFEGFNSENVMISDMSFDSPVSTYKGFASNLAVVYDSSDSADAYLLNAKSGILVDITSKDVIYKKNIFGRTYPASTTKILTSLLAIENSDIKEVRVMGDEVVIDTPNASLCDFRVGDSISFDIVLHGTLIFSGNDAAAALALFAADSMSEFVDMMNSKAHTLGATGSYFVNPHGLHNAGHYTTPYDMYLIFNECIKNSYFMDVVGCEKYYDTFSRTTAVKTYVIAADYKSTNPFISGSVATPDGVTVYGGKSGTTDEAGNCYINCFEYKGHTFIEAVFGSEGKEKRNSDLVFLVNKAMESL